MKLISGLILVLDKLWIIGDKMLVLDKERSIQTLQIIPSSEVTRSIHLIDDYVWVNKGNNIEVWDIHKQTCIKIFEGIINGEMVSALKMGPYVWLTGSQSKNGVIWIIDPNELQVINIVTTSHSGLIYSAKQIGELIWTYSNDKKIQTWRTDDFKTITECVTITLDHRDYVSCLLVKPHQQGYSLWSASSDHMLNVHYLSSSYDQNIPKALSRDPKPANKRSQLRGGLKRSTTLGSSRCSSEEENRPGSIIIISDTSSNASVDSQPTTVDRRARFAKARTPSGHSGRIKVARDELQQSKDPLSKSRIKKSQNHVVTTKRERRLSTEPTERRD